MLAALLIVQFFISPEIFVMSLLFAAVGLVAVIVVGWRQVGPRAGHAVPALGLAAGLAVVVLGVPGLVRAGRAASPSRGVLFALAPLTGVPLSGLAGTRGATPPSPTTYVRFGGYLGRNGPPPDYVGGGVALVAVASVVLGRRRPLTWLLVLLVVVSLWLSLGALLIGGPAWLSHVWLPWAQLSRLPVLKEILPDQFAPFIALFAAFLIAVGVDAFVARPSPRRLLAGGPPPWRRRGRHGVGRADRAGPGVRHLQRPAPRRAGGRPSVRPQRGRLAAARTRVLLTVPFAVSGSTPPMLWQATGGMHFRLAGAGVEDARRHRGAGRHRRAGVGAATF